MNDFVVLLDRDGTIIVERDYLSDPAQVTLESGALNGLKCLAGAGARLVVITNQSGVGRGYFDQSAVEAVHARLAQILAADGVVIAGWYVCPHAPDTGCDCRKPMPGLVRQAAADLNFNPQEAYVVGDKASDIGLSETTGATSILVRSGYGVKTHAAMAGRAIRVAEDLSDAAEQIIADFNSRKRKTES